MSQQNIWILILFLKNLLLYFWLCWVFIALCRLSQVVGASLQFFIVACELWSVGPVVVAHELSDSSDYGIFPEQEIQLVTPVLASGFLSTAPRKSWILILNAFSNPSLLCFPQCHCY